MNHILGLQSLGHSITVLAKRIPGEAFRIPHLEDKSKTTPEKTPDIDILYYSTMRQKNLPIFLLCNLFFFIFLHPIFFIRLSKQIIIHHDFAVLQAILALKLLRNKSFDITHAEFGYLGNMALAIRSFNITTGPLCVSFRGEDISSHLRKNPHLYKLLIQRGDLFLPVCGYFKEHLYKLGFPKEKIRVYHSAVNLSLFPYFIQKPVEKTGLAPAVPVPAIKLIAIGRFVAKKGFDLALDVLKLLVDSGLEASMEIIGDGPEKTGIIAKANKLNLSEKVILPGWIEHKNIMGHLQESTFFLCTSTTPQSGDIEGIPNVLKEAMATGLPVIAFDHSGIKELIYHEKTGFLMPENDTALMANIIMKIISEHIDLDPIRKNARTLIENEYSLIIQAQRAEKFYTALLSGQNVPVAENVSTIAV
jgi:glycosyltransferase involved in cell wall biosynthesis